jgi:hypothetical protein
MDILAYLLELLTRRFGAVSTHPGRVGGREGRPVAGLVWVTLESDFSSGEVPAEAGSFKNLKRNVRLMVVMNRGAKSTKCIILSISIYSRVC